MVYPELRASADNGRSGGRTVGARAAESRASNERIGRIAVADIRFGLFLPAGTGVVAPSGHDVFPPRSPRGDDVFPPRSPRGDDGSGRGRLLISSGATLLASLSIAVTLHVGVGAQPASSSSAAELEARGDAAWKKAHPYYSKAYLTGLRVEEEAAKLGALQTVRRARDARRRLGALLREPMLATESSDQQVRGGGPGDEFGAYEAARRLVVSRHPDVPPGALKKVVKFLGDARACSRSRAQR